METSKWVKIWLLAGLVMIFIQVVVGGITRLTGSGLSITKWEIVTGTLPPLSEDEWEREFDLYKDTPQYMEINEGMEMGGIFQSGTFKFIYFWEYIHRLWARIMGFVFIIPLVFFLYFKQIGKPLLKRLVVVFLLAALAASFGWIMVASGLVERPWVNAYKLALHLTIAFAVFSYLLWTYFLVNEKDKTLDGHLNTGLRKLASVFTIILWVQIFLGGVMSGMKAAVIYPTWPDLNGEIIPQVIFDSNSWTVDNFNYYDRNLLLPALVHVMHRTSAYILFFIGLYLSYKVYITSTIKRFRNSSLIVGLLLITQVVLGIVTVVNSKGSIPLVYGVLHQAVALLLLAGALHLNFSFKKAAIK